jgi:glucose-1-phosphate cytidylyltransferase
VKPPTIILCGGRGTRAYPHTIEVPKPLMEVAARPIVHHVMEIYATQGFTRFILAAGYGVDSVRRFADALPAKWQVDVVDTGEDTHKGDRVLRVRDLIDGTFFLTYADGVGDIDLRFLLDFHLAHGGSATITTVPLPSQYGTLDTTPDGRVVGFQEKPKLSDHWINAGFMVMEERVFDHWSGDLESDVLPALAEADELYAYRHDGFWKSLDTYKDSLDLDSIARRAEAEHGNPPWQISEARASS